MKYHKFTIVITLILMIRCLLLPAQEDWELVKEENGIMVFTRSNEGFDFKTFKAQIELEASVHEFVSVLMDIKNFRDWGYKIKNSKILKRVGDTVQIYYSEAKAPFPYKNRDGIYLNRFNWSPENRTLFVDIEVLPDYLEEKNNLVRVKGSGFWKVVVSPSGQLNVTFQLQLDPGGGIPAWLANIFVDDTPYHTLLNLREIISTGKYKNKPVSFIN